METLEDYFDKYRQNIVGINQTFKTPFGEKELVYADWVASGRLYKPIEEKMLNTFGPFVGNTHSGTSITGIYMTKAYNEARRIIKEHVNADENDVLITAGFGMTTVINKFQRLLGLRFPEQLDKYIKIPDEERPVVFITHMEHHSNQTSWLETIADCEVIKPNDEGLVDLNYFYELLNKYKDRKLKIGSFSAASNVTGVQPDYHLLAKIMHEHGGLCFVDFAAAAPYVDIDMHPKDPKEKLDAIFFSPHKFLGGPGTSGVLVFDSKLYNRKVPDHPGGGTVDWTNPWGGHKYMDDIERREDGGTPGFLEAIKAALVIKLKEEMGTENIQNREEQLLEKAYTAIDKISEMHLLANTNRKRLGILSFYVEDLHYNLIVKLLNDIYGIQVRGGCSCAGTYGHYLLHIDPTRSKRITDEINHGDLSEKPGWVRLSLHPTMSDKELNLCMDALKDIVINGNRLAKYYNYSTVTNEFHHIDEENPDKLIRNWFF